MSSYLAAKFDTMKKSMLQVTLLLTILLCPWHCFSQEAAVEESLHQTLHDQHYNTYRSEATDFVSACKLPFKKKIQYDPVLVNELQKIRPSIDTMISQTGKIFTGFRIFYGYDTAAQKLILIFYPLIAKDKYPVPGTDTARYQLNKPADILDGSFNGNDTVYIANGLGALQPVLAKETAVKQYVSNYRTKVRFEQWGGGTRPFDDTADFKSIFYTFQEIEMLLPGVNTVYFVSRIHFDAEHYHGKVFRHCISIAPDEPFAAAPKFNYVADVMMACPPQCDQAITVANEVIAWIGRDGKKGAHHHGGAAMEGDNPNQEWYYMGFGILGMMVGSLVTFVIMKRKRD